MGRRLFGMAFGMCVSLAVAGPASAHWLAPSSFADCNMSSPAYPFQARLEAARQQADQCYKANSQPQWVSACGHLGPRVCLPVYRQSCAIQDEMQRLGEKCRALFEARRARDAAEKKRREQQERAERAAADRAERDAATFGRQVPQGVSSGLRAALGVTGGAWPLSDALTRGGTAGVAGIQRLAMNQLLAGMDGVSVDRPGSGSGYSASHPRRSQSQLDHALGSLALDGEARRVEAMGNQLPLGGHSIVDGAYSAIVTRLVEAQAQGHIDTPLAAIGIAVATWAAWEAGQAEMQMQEEERQRFTAAAEALLPKQRAIARVAFEAVEALELEELKRQALEAREMENTSVEVLEPSPTGIGKPDMEASGGPEHCVQITYGAIVNVWNKCSFSVRARFNCLGDPNYNSLILFPNHRHEETNERQSCRVTVSIP